MMPTPTPAPPMPMHAMPAPISFAAACSIFSSLGRKTRCRWKFPGPLVSWMNGVVEVNAGQDRKHIGLQERNQQFESGQRDGEGQRQNTAGPAECAKRNAEHADETGEHL